MRDQINLLDAQQALGFVVPQFYNIEQTIYEIKYPSFDYASLVPVITEGNEWARGTLFRSMDSAGKAEFLSGKAQDMPFADVTRNQFTQAYQLAGIGYEWSLEELSVAALEGINLDDSKARAARRISEQFLWNVAMTGRTDGVVSTSEKGWTGLLNDPNVPTVTAAAGASGQTSWTSKTPDEIVRDVNSALAGVVSNSQETEDADTVLIPTAAYLFASSTPRSPNSDTTILDFILNKNAFTARTGQPLTIRAMRTLNTAGAAGSRRMVAYRRAPDVVRFHLPMPHRFLPPFQANIMTWQIGGIMRTGGTEIRLPGAVSYVDGI